MRPLFAYLLIATVGLTAVRCTIKESPIYHELRERNNQVEQLLQ